MICKKTSKEKTAKDSAAKAKKSKQVIKGRRHCDTQSSSTSGAKNIKGRPKKSCSVGSIDKSKNKTKTKINDKKDSEKSRQTNGKTESKRRRRSMMVKKNIKNIKSEVNRSKNKNKSKKSSRIKKIKEVVEKVKSKTSDKVKQIIKRNLRNNCEITTDSKLYTKSKKMKNSSDCRTKNSKQTFHTKGSNSETNEKPSVKHVSQNSTKFNFCSKFFPTFDSNDNKGGERNDSKARLRNYSKSVQVLDLKEIEDKSCKKSKQFVDTGIDSKHQKQDKDKDKDKKQTKSTKNARLCANNKSVKPEKEKKSSVKSKKKSNTKVKQKNGLSICRRGHRLASLNALAKVRLLCENDTEKSEPIDRLRDRSKDKQMEKRVQIDRKSGTKADKCESKSKRSECKALVAVDNRKAVAVHRKRKIIDDCVEIIDTRSCKRMASLNASAIMAASYSPERGRRSKSVESNHSNNSIEMVREMQTFSQTVSRYEISPSVTALNAIHVNQVSHQNSVILSEQKHETIETMKQLKVSNKIKDRLLGIARLERQEKAKQKRLEKKNRNSLQNENQTNVLTSPEMAGFQATKVHVTKVTHINASQGLKCLDKDKKKSSHQINSILETDSSIVHKYQVQTKATIQMQTTFNSNTGSTIANVTTLTAPPSAAITNPITHMPIHMPDASVMATPGPAQPTYYSLGTANPTVVQVHNNFPTLGPSTSTLNPMPIINLSDPYPPHYSSAFSVPHFATHTHPNTLTQSPFAYLNPGLYQPAGPLLQGFQDPCLIHKPIPFHPPTPQVNQVHSSPQFSTSSPSAQTFATDMSQTFASSPQFYSQIQSPIRPPPTVFFQALPQTNGTAFTLLNPGLHYSHPAFISEQLATNRENAVLTNQLNFSDLTNIDSNVVSSDGKRSTAQTSNVSLQTVSTSSQCSPQTRDEPKNAENSRCSAVDSSELRIQRIATNTKHNTKSDKYHKKKKSLLLNPSSSMKTSEEVIRINKNNSQTSNGKQSVVDSGERSAKQISISSNSSIKANSVAKNKNVKTACIQISPSLPSVVIQSAPLESLSERQLASKKLNRKRFSHGWSWEGSPKHKHVYLNNEEQSYSRKCFPAIRHNEGDVIRVRDCVLLRSGPRKTDLPFVAKISALWESPEGEMMMSLLWYYRPEHTDLEYYSNQLCAEIFASKHRDTNSVACIDDKCYVLTYNEFCRYRRSKLENQWTSGPSLTASIVPVSDEPYPRTERIPPPRVLPELVFYCRKVYDYRQKRILKNPI